MAPRSRGRGKRANKWVRTNTDVDFEVPSKRRAEHYEASDAERVLDQVPRLMHQLPPTGMKRTLFLRRKRKLEKLMKEGKLDETEKLMRKMVGERKGSGLFDLTPRAEYASESLRFPRSTLTVAPRRSDLRRGKWPPLSDFRKKGEVVANISPDGYYRFKSEVAQKMSSRSSGGKRYKAVEFDAESKETKKAGKKKKLYVPARF